MLSFSKTMAAAGKYIANSIEQTYVDNLIINNMPDEEIVETVLHIKLPRDYRDFIKYDKMFENDKLTVFGLDRTKSTWKYPSIIWATRYFKYDQKLFIPIGLLHKKSLVLMDKQTGAIFIDQFGIPMPRYRNFSDFFRANK